MAKTGRLDNESEQPREDALADEAAAVEDQVAEAEQGEERRVRDRERALDRKTTPKGGTEPPTEIARSGDKAYSVDRLIADGPNFLGYEPHVVAGAFYGIDREYLTLDEADDLIKSWLGTPVISSLQGEEEVA